MPTLADEIAGADADGRARRRTSRPSTFMSRTSPPRRAAWRSAACWSNERRRNATGRDGRRRLRGTAGAIEALKAASKAETGGAARLPSARRWRRSAFMDGRCGAGPRSTCAGTTRKHRSASITQTERASVPLLDGTVKVDSRAAVHEPRYGRTTLQTRCRASMFVATSSSKTVLDALVRHGE